MSMARVLLGLWRNSAETSESSNDPKIKTHYYKISKRLMLEKVNHVINNKMRGWKITHMDEDRGEILVEKKGVRTNQIVVTIFQVDPVRSAVDVVSAYKEGFGDLGASYFTIVKFYQALNEEVEPIRNH